MLILLSHPRLYLPSVFFPSGLLTKIEYTFLLAPMRAILRDRFTDFHFISLIIFSEEYKSQKDLVIQISPRFYHFICFAPNILFNILILTPSIYDLPLISDTKFYNHTKLRTNLYFHIYISTFLNSRREDERFEIIWKMKKENNF
jgi:hypothetical protein